MKNFYILNYADVRLFGTKWAYFDATSSGKDFSDYENCPSCGMSVSRTRQLPPLKIKLSSGKPEKWGDFAWGIFFTPLVTDKFKRLYEREKLTGIKFFHPAAEVVRVGTRKSGDFPARPPKYYFIEVAWNGANQDDVMSEIVREPVSNPAKQGFCSYCRTGSGLEISRKGVFIEKDSWAGLDIFELRGGPPNPVVSERFKQVIEKSDLKNYRFIPSENFAYDMHHSTGWYEKE